METETNSLFRAEAQRRKIIGTLEIALLIVVALILFGGGGFYWGRRGA